MKTAFEGLGSSSIIMIPQSYSEQCQQIKQFRYEGPLKYSSLMQHPVPMQGCAVKTALLQMEGVKLAGVDWCVSDLALTCYLAYSWFAHTVLRAWPTARKFFCDCTYLKLQRVES